MWPLSKEQRGVGISGAAPWENQGHGMRCKHLAPVAISLATFRCGLAASPGVGCVDISLQPLRAPHAGSAESSQPGLQVFNLLFPEL